MRWVAFVEAVAITFKVVMRRKWKNEEKARQMSESQPEMKCHTGDWCSPDIFRFLRGEWPVLEHTCSSFATLSPMYQEAIQDVFGASYSHNL